MTTQITPEVTDAKLVARARAGELDAFEALTNRYEQRVYSLALRMLRQEQDAEDVTQQTANHRGSGRFMTARAAVPTVSAGPV